MTYKGWQDDTHTLSYSADGPRGLRSGIDRQEVRRAFEIWPAQKFEQIVRGLGDCKTQHVSGTLGGLDGVERVSGHGAKGVWMVTNRALFTRRFKNPLPADGADAARKFSRALAEKRSALDPHPDLFPQQFVSATLFDTLPS